MCSSKRSASQIQQQKAEFKKKKKQQQQQQQGHDRIEVPKKQGFKKRKEKPHDCVLTVLKICRELLDDNGGGLETLSDDEQGAKHDRMKLVSVREEEGRFTCCNCCKCKEKRPEAGLLIPTNLENQNHGGLSEPALPARAPLTRSSYSIRKKVKILLRDLGRRLASDTYGASMQLLAQFLCSVFCRGLAKFICFTVSKTWFQNSQGFNDPNPT